MWAKTGAEESLPAGIWIQICVLPQGDVDPKAANGQINRVVGGALEPICVKNGGGAPGGASGLEPTLDDARAGLPERGQGGLPAKMAKTTLLSEEFG